jgi:hypothetical protein
MMSTNACLVEAENASPRSVGGELKEPLIFDDWSTNMSCNRRRERYLRRHLDPFSVASRHELMEADLARELRAE